LFSGFGSLVIILASLRSTANHCLVFGLNSGILLKRATQRLFNRIVTEDLKKSY
jgi:hypothetical protein